MQCEIDGAMSWEGTRIGPELTYSWPRFWVPRDGVIDLSDGGFLRDPTDWLAGPRSPCRCRRFSIGGRSPCWANPASANPATLKEEADRVASVPRRIPTLSSIYVDLRAFSSEPLLYQRVFESEKFIGMEEWQLTPVLHLDSLDEALLRIDSIANLLAAELPGHPDGPPVDPHRLPHRGLAGRHARSRAERHMG